jgi:hypothetical protein
MAPRRSSEETELDAVVADLRLAREVAGTTPLG